MPNLQIEISIRPKRVRHHPATANAQAPHALPRATRLLALAIKFQDMVDRGEVRDYADLARLGYVTRARLTQIMNLTLLAPPIQEAILFSSPTAQTERALRALCVVPAWSEQLERFDSARSS